MKRVGNYAWAMLTLSLALGAAGCASQGGAASTPAPQVQECAVVAISSPPKYACNGKVYTAFELTRLRAEQEKSYKAGR